MNLQDELKVLKQRIAELEEQEKRGREFPLEGDKYWFMSDSGGVIDTSFYRNYYIDNDRIDIGNFFRTEEQAELAVEKLKVEAELRKFSRPFEDNNNNYYIEFCLFDKTLSIDNNDCFQTQGTIYFESTTIANEAIDAIGADRIKKYIFEVED